MKKVLARLFPVLLLGLISGGNAVATPTWTNGNTNPGDWNTANNWSTGALPTAASVADFTGTGTVTSVNLSNTGVALSLLFSGPLGYTLTSSGSADTLTLATGGSITSTAGVTETVNAPIILGTTATTTYTFGNTTEVAPLIIGGTVTGNSTSGTAAVTLTGDSLVNQLNGNVTDGSGPDVVSFTQSAGNWYVSGSNNYSGGYTLSGGVLQIGSSTALGTGTLTILGSSNPEFEAGGPSVSATNNLYLNASAAVVFTGSNNLALGALTDHGSQTLYLQSTSTLTLNGITLTNSGSGTGILLPEGTGNLAVTGTIADGNATGQYLRDDTSGTTTISATYNATGNEEFNGGTAILDYSSTSAGGGTGASANRITSKSGGLVFSGVNVLLSGGSYTQATTGATTFGAGQTTIYDSSSGGSSVLALNAISPSSSVGVAIDFGPGAVSTTSGTAGTPIGEDETYNKTYWAVGSGTITAYTGETTLMSPYNGTTTGYGLINGSLSVATTGNAALTGLLRITESSTGTLTIGTGNTFQIGGGGLLFTGSSNYDITGGNLQLNSTYAVFQDWGSGSLQIDSVLINKSATNTILVKAGSGSLILTAPNTYTGATFLNDGILSISADNNIGLDTGTLATLYMDGGTLEFTSTGTLSGTGGNRPVSIYPDGGTFQVDGANTLTIPAVIAAATGAPSLTKTGTGTLSLTSATAETYTGGTNVNAGTLLLNLANQLSSANTAPVTINSGTLAIQSFNQAFSTFTLTGNGSITGAGTITTTLGATLDSGTVNAVLAGTGQAINKNSDGTASSGTVTLTNNNTYTGTTSVNAGTLLVTNSGASNGSGTGTGSVQVASGGTLGGSGFIYPSGSGATINVASGGNITPGVLTAGALPLASALTVSNPNSYAAVLAFATPTGGTSTTPQLTFSISNGTALTGDTSGLTFAGASTYVKLGSDVASEVSFNNNIVQINNLGAGSGNYLLFQAATQNSAGSSDYAGLTLGTGGQITAGLSISGAPANESLYLSNGDIYLDVASVPEPGTTALLVLGGVLLVAFHRFRVKLA